MTLHQLPELTQTPMTTDDRLDNIEARLDVLIEGVRSLLAEVVAIRERFDK